MATALLVEYKHLKFAVDSGFDGVYTYFAADDFSFGLTFSNWPGASSLDLQQNLHPKFWSSLQ